jgi:hypothetical protein
MSNDGPIYSMLTGKAYGPYVCIKTTETDSLYPNGYNFYYCLTGCDTNPNCDVNYPVSCYNGQGAFYSDANSHCCGLSGTCGDCINNQTYPCPEFCDGASPDRTWSIECYNVASCANCG